MAISLSGLTPGVEREYVWIGDDAVDLAASDVSRWLDKGEGLALKEGGDPVRFRLRALSPTVLQIVYNHARMGATVVASAEVVDQLDIARRNMPAVYRAAVAYAVVAIENGGELKAKRQADAGGLRLADDVLDTIDRITARMEVGDGTTRIRLIEHLGLLALSDSQPTEQEKKA